MGQHPCSIRKELRGLGRMEDLSRQETAGSYSREEWLVSDRVPFHGAGGVCQAEDRTSAGQVIPDPRGGKVTFPGGWTCT